VWQRILTLSVKEFFAALRDPKTRFLLIVAPLLQLLVFTHAVTQEARNVPLGVLNQDWGRYSTELVARFRGAPYTFSEVVPLDGVAEAERALAARRVLAVLHVGPTFSRDLAAGRPATVQLLLDGRKANAAQLVQGYAAAVVAQFNDDLAAGSAPTAGAVVARVWFNPNLEATWNSVPTLVAALSMTIGLMVTALSVARERELGTFDQLLVSPLSPAEIVAGKTLPALAIGLAQGTLSLAVGVLVYRIPLTGSLGLLYLSLTVFLASIVGVGLFVSSLVTTQQQAILGAFVFMVPALLLSGFATPVENMPDWLQTVTLLDPLRHFLVVVKGVFLKAMPADEVLRRTAPMALIALATLSAATWLFRRRLE